MEKDYRNFNKLRKLYVLAIKWQNQLYNPKAIHICNSHEPTLDQKLQKSTSCQRIVEIKTCSKFERENDLNEGKPAPNK